LGDKVKTKSFQAKLRSLTPTFWI